MNKKKVQKKKKRKEKKKKNQTHKTKQAFKKQITCGKGIWWRMRI